MRLFPHTKGPLEGQLKEPVDIEKYLRDQPAMGNLAIRTQDVYAYIEETKRK